MKNNINFSADYHTHSSFSSDASSSVAENITSAVRQNITVLQINDHVRRDTSWVAEFVRTVRGSFVPPDFTLYCAVETKLLDVKGNLDLPHTVFSDFDILDRVVVGDHQFPGMFEPQTPVEMKQLLLDKKFTEENLVEIYVAASINMMCRYPNLQLGHWFSLFPKIGISSMKISDVQLNSFCETVAKTNSVIEINEKWGCPGPRVIRNALEFGNNLVCGSDSHNAADIGKYSRVKQIFAAATLGIA